MALHNWFSSPFKFSVVPVSALLVVVYAVAFAAVSVTDATPEVPEDQGGLSLHQAYRDLHRITARPHPFISHDNDDVREYLLERLNTIVSSQDYLHLSYDTVSNATWLSERGATYYESNNILVKVDGTEAPAIRSRGVLFSAHYDSVSTAPGATDDGMGIVTLLQMVEYLSKPERRPRRTAVFFFNNGEEDGLNGAHLYFEHPWSNLTTSFVNLEGAAAGGRPMLFRSTSLGAARSFGAKGVRHPHGNVVSADAFARGVIRSGTDYSVYAQGITGEQKGMQGLDFAFYKNRAFYHTPFDSISGMGRDEGRKALWAMMETVRGAGLNLLNGPAADDNTEAGVYFDILGRTMVSFSLRTLFIVHVVGLIVAPLVVLGLLGWVLLLNHKASLHEPDARPEHHTPLDRMRLVVARIIGWGRFWIALLVTIGLNAALVAGYVNLNPYIIYSKPLVVLTTFLALTFLSYTATLSLFYKLWPSPPAAQKFAIILETYLLSWVFMVAGTVGVNKFGLGSPYLVTAWYLCTWVTAVIALTEAVIRSKKFGSTPDLDVVQEPESAVEESTNGHRFVRGVMYTAPEQAESREEVARREPEPEETEPTEITPLIQQHRRRSTGGREYIIGVDNEPLLVNEMKKTTPHYEEYGWWIAQMITLIPLPTILLFQIMLILAHSLRNTLADGNSPSGVYTPLAALSILLFLNIAPFAHQVERTVQLSVLAVFVITLIYAWTAFPFTQDAPLKIFFEQSVHLAQAGSLVANTAADSLMQGSATAVSAATGPVVQATTVLAGIYGFLGRRIIRELPSSWGRDISCNIDKQTRVGLEVCSWSSDLIPSPGGNVTATNTPYPEHNTKPQWFTLNTTRIDVSTARINIKGFNTRSCQLQFDHPIHSFKVLNGGGRQLPGYDMPTDGVKSAVLYSREWEKEFQVEVGWAGSDPDFVMEGRAACEWAEYASATAGGPHAGTSAQIPALEEVKASLPLWAVPTKYKVGLVEAWTRFKL